MIISQETSGNFNTNSSSWTPIPGLVLRVSQVVGETVLFILNVPNPWAAGSSYPGGNFGIQINGQIQGPFAAFTYSDQSPSTPGRVPTTLCVAAEPKGPITAVAVWSAIRGSTVHIDSPATLTMSFEQNKGGAARTVPPVLFADRAISSPCRHSKSALADFEH